jgi:hypothetical protein
VSRAESDTVVGEPRILTICQVLDDRPKYPPLPGSILKRNSWSKKVHLTSRELSWKEAPAASEKSAVANGFG